MLLILKHNFVVMSTGGWDQPDGSPCSDIFTYPRGWHRNRSILYFVLHLLDGLRVGVGAGVPPAVVVLGDDPEVVPRHLALGLDPGQRPAHVREVGPGSPEFMFSPEMTAVTV